MSTHIVGFKPADNKWLAMKRVWDTCAEAKIDPPKEVLDFFNHEPPDDLGVEVDEKLLRNCGCVKEYCDNMADGFEIDVTKLPSDVKIIRVWNSY